MTDHPNPEMQARVTDMLAAHLLVVQKAYKAWDTLTPEQQEEQGGEVMVPPLMLEGMDLSSVHFTLAMVEAVEHHQKIEICSAEEKAAMMQREPLLVEPSVPFMTFVTLRNCQLDYASFAGLPLYNCVIENCEGVGVILSQAQMKNAAISDCVLTMVEAEHMRLVNCLVTGTRFHDSSFERSSWVACGLVDVDFEGASLRMMSVESAERWEDVNIIGCDISNGALLQWNGVDAYQPDILDQMRQTMNRHSDQERIGGLEDMLRNLGMGPRGL